jgi:UDP-N-acetylmuramate dehydrogenase
MFKQNNFFVVGAWFNGLKRGKREDIESLMNKIKEERTAKFPLEYPNGGSVFKRPKGDYAGRLIEISGCGGMSVGGACVSEKHKGFIVNKNNATSSDIKQLIKKVQQTVQNKTGILLEREQIFLPEDII